MIGMCARRRLTVLVLTATVGCTIAAHSVAQATAGAARNARLSGRVMVCQPNFGPCAPAKATITVLEVHGTKLGGSVASKTVSNGQFSFLLAPGKYFPSATAVHAHLKGGKCISGEVVVAAHEHVTDNVRCTPKQTS